MSRKCEDLMGRKFGHLKESMIEFLILNMWKYQNETHNHKENDLRWINFESNFRS